MRKFIVSLFLALGLSSPVWAAPHASDFGKLPSIYDAAISPDGSRIALFQNIGGQYGIRLVQIKGEGKDLGVVMLGKGVKPEWIKWANNGRILASLWSNQKIRNTPVTTGFIYTIDAATMKGKMLVEPEGIVRQYNNDVIDFLDDDPDHILMSFSDKRVFEPDVQKVNVVTGRNFVQRRGRPDVQTWTTDLRGEVRVGQGMADSSKEKWSLTIRDADEKSWRTHKDYPGLEADDAIFGFTSDPNELVVGQYADKDTLGMYVYDLSQKRITRKLFHHDEYDAQGLIFSSDGDDIAGASYVADSREREMFDEYKSVLDRLRAKLPGYNIDFVDQSRDGDLVIANVSSSYDPGALMLADTRTGDYQRISYSREWFDSDEMGSVIDVRYTARDGFKIPAYITLPPSVTDATQIKDMPFIILPHGGPYARSSKRFDYFAQFFATRGFGVLQMNFRGSSGYGQAFEDAGRENWVLMQDDVEDGARWLMEKGYADPDRTCIAGWSYGGYAALMGAVKNSDLYACAVSMAGVTDLADLVADLKKYRFGKIAAKNSVLSGFDNKKDMKANSPVKRAEEITIPVFLAHGEDDQRVHFDQYKRMKSALKKSPANHTFVDFKDEDHFLSDQSNRQEFFTELDKFLKKHVGESEFAR